MKITSKQLQGKSRILQSLTGLNQAEFERLLLSFEQAWERFVAETFRNKRRSRGYGAGRIAQLKTHSDKLLFILIYFRIYPTQKVQGFLFGISHWSLD